MYSKDENGRSYAGNINKAYINECGTYLLPQTISMSAGYTYERYINECRPYLQVQNISTSAGHVYECNHLNYLVD